MAYYAEIVNNGKIMKGYNFTHGTISLMEKVTKHVISEISEIIKHTLHCGITKVQYKRIPFLFCICFKNEYLTIIVIMNNGVIDDIQAHNAIYELIDLANDDTTTERTLKTYVELLEYSVSSKSTIISTKKYDSREIINSELYDIMNFDMPIPEKKKIKSHTHRKLDVDYVPVKSKSRCIIS